MTFVLKYDPVYLAEPKLVWSSEMLGVLELCEHECGGRVEGVRSV